MNSAEKMQMAATATFLDALSHRITHITVAHTRYRTFERDEFGMARIVEMAKQDCRHFRNCLNKELYGRRAQRKPLLYQPLLIATLEGSLVNTDRDLTLHYNFSFGNLPAGITDADFENTFRECWVDRAKQRNNIWHYRPGDSEDGANGWLGYSMKEAQSRGNLEVWDFQNTQIPYEAFGAG